MSANGHSRTTLRAGTILTMADGAPSARSVTIEGERIAHATRAA
jgi:hypothetical protein